MKNSLIAYFVLLVLSVHYTHAQGYSLQFNRVIDTSLFVSVPSSCTDLTSNGQSSAAVTVPSGKIWKIESIGPLEYNGSTTLYTSCSYSSYQSNNTIWGLYADDGSRSSMKRYAYLLSGTYTEQSCNLPVWLRAGTSVYVCISARNISYRFTDGTPMNLRTHLSILEFNLIPSP